ncbi:hypothetical protein EVAR_24654_1 [Eumeta japonica]|uniref:Uncharacterized protein n=1 Tax=Eumeta variegata TaxID=151549 RepID=A0A4C1V1S8_EUMVA|nr:hypothetical protein EVAR_24654_1 [Eumeta japonica]
MNRLSLQNKVTNYDRRPAHATGLTEPSPTSAPLTFHRTRICLSIQLFLEKEVSRRKLSRNVASPEHVSRIELLERGRSVCHSTTLTFPALIRTSEDSKERRGETERQIERDIARDALKKLSFVTRGFVSTYSLTRGYKAKCGWVLLYMQKNGKLKDEEGKSS